MANGAVYVGQWRGDLRDGFGKQAGRDEVRKSTCAGSDSGTAWFESFWKGIATVF